MKLISFFQNTEMIIMLTNLEEYNRVKCAQYWPGAGDSNYVVSPNCLINVGFCTEKRYSDYIVRELNMTVKTQKKDDTKATTIIRKVRHYHYLQWKDFNAPEHAPRVAGPKPANQGRLVHPWGCGAPGPWQALSLGPNGRSPMHPPWGPCTPG